MLRYNLHTQDVRGVEGNIDEVEQWKINEIKQFYFRPKRTCLDRQDVKDCVLQFEYRGCDCF